MLDELVQEFSLSKPCALWKEQGRCSHEAEEDMAEWVGEGRGGHSCSGEFTDPGHTRAARLAPHGRRKNIVLSKEDWSWCSEGASEASGQVMWQMPVD